MNKLLIFLITYSCFASCQPAKPIVRGDVAIFNVSLLPMTEGANVIDNQSIVFQDGVISHIGSFNLDSIETVVDGTGKFLMPGLTEMHAHIPVPVDGDDLLLRETLFLYLSQGITTIRGMLGAPYHLELKKKIASGDILGPRVYTSSPSMNGNTVTTPQEAASKVRKYKEEGYDFLKIHPGIQLENWVSLEKTAKEVGMPFSGHVPVNVGVRRALSDSYGTIDHMDGYLEGLVPAEANVNEDEGGFFGYGFTSLADLSLIPDLVELTIQNNVAVVPTQSLFVRWFSPKDPAVMLQEPEMKYMPSETRFRWRQAKTRLISDTTYSAQQWSKYIDIRKVILREMDTQGVIFLLGSDAPQVMNVPGFSLHHEMQAMADAGISNHKILNCGTAAPAKFFNAQGQYGTIEVGAAADLLLLGGNPLEDLGNASNIESVFVRGHQLTRQDIDTHLSQVGLRNQ